MKRFPTPVQVAVLAATWAAVLFAVDALERPRAAGAAFTSAHVTSTKAPRLSLWVNHLCCSGCLDDLATALEPFPWLPRHGIRVLGALPDMGSVDESAPSPAAGFGNRVDLAVTDVRLVDFVALDRAIRDAGLVADHMELSGIPHVRFAAELKHVCCKLCASATAKGLTVLETLRGGGQMVWLDSLAFSKERKTVVAHARYDSTVDVSELIAGLNRVGFAPSSVHAVLDPER